MTSEPTPPVRSAGDVPGLPAVPGTNQQTKRRRPFSGDRKRRRQQPPRTQTPEAPQADATTQPPDAAGDEEGHIDCLA